MKALKYLLIFLAIWTLILCTYGCKKEKQPDVCQSCNVKYTDQVNGLVRIDSNTMVLCNDERLNAINTEQIVFNSATGHNELKQTICK